MSCASTFLRDMPHLFQQQTGTGTSPTDINYISFLNDFKCFQTNAYLVTCPQVLGNSIFINSSNISFWRCLEAIVGNAWEHQIATKIKLGVSARRPCVQVLSDLSSPKSVFLGSCLYFLGGSHTAVLRSLGFALKSALVVHRGTIKLQRSKPGLDCVQGKCCTSFIILAPQHVLNHATSFLTFLDVST